MDANFLIHAVELTLETGYLDCTSNTQYTMVSDFGSTQYYRGLASYLLHEGLHGWILWVLDWTRWLNLRAVRAAPHVLPLRLVDHQASCVTLHSYGFLVAKENPRDDKTCTIPFRYYTPYQKTMAHMQCRCVDKGVA